ncbi:MAG: hypothetical protein E2O40_07485 [Planctomycetota bacterium]|nr:MAG: hypothetical protein E2O40_07485 [Planctomycetota bacterium]
MDVDDVIIEADNCPEPSGACCVGQNDCQFVEESECGNLAGIYLGHGAQCDVPICNATLLCQGATGDCFSANGTPGCEQAEPGSFPLPSPSCCALVCSQGAPFDLCCAAPWQQFCADLAESLCPIVICVQPADNCQVMDLFDTIGPAESAAGSAQVADNFTPASNGDITSVCYYGTYFAGVDYEEDEACGMQAVAQVEPRGPAVGGLLADLLPRLGRGRPLPVTLQRPGIVGGDRRGGVLGDRRSAGPCRRGPTKSPPPSVR